MHILTKARLRDFGAHHPASMRLLEEWHAVVDKAVWTCFADVKKTYNSVDRAGKLYIFNVNSNRIIVDIAFQTGRVFIKHVFTHAEYDHWNKENR